MPQIELNINGRNYTFDVDENETLLTDFTREDLI